MTANMAMKRAAKANRRKAIVAEKRKAEQLAASLPERVRRAAGLPFRYCLVPEELFEHGTGLLVLARGVSDDSLFCGIFLLDTFCLGVKDAFFRHLPFETLEDWDDVMVFKEFVPSYGRKLLRDLAAWSRSLGFAQAPDFPIIEALFGDVSADDCDASFKFGSEGRPLYIPGPYDSVGEIGRRAALLRNRAA